MFLNRAILDMNMKCLRASPKLPNPRKKNLLRYYLHYQPSMASLWWLGSLWRTTWNFQNPLGSKLWGAHHGKNKESDHWQARWAMNKSVGPIKDLTLWTSWGDVFLLFFLVIVRLNASIWGNRSLWNPFLLYRCFNHDFPKDSLTKNRRIIKWNSLSVWFSFGSLLPSPYISPWASIHLQLMRDKHVVACHFCGLVNWCSAKTSPWDCMGC